MTTGGWFKRVHKDHLAGGLMVLVGLGAVYFAWPLNAGTLVRMGPGFFPIAVGTILALIGVAIAVTAGREDEDDSVVMDVPGESENILQAAHAAAHRGPAKPEWRGWSLIIGAFVAFVVLFEFTGMVLAVAGMTVIAAFAERGNSWKAILILTLCLEAIAIVVFWWALQMPFKLFSWWHL